MLDWPVDSMEAQHLIRTLTQFGAEQVRSLNKTISDLIAYRFALREAAKELMLVIEEMPRYAYDDRGHEAYERKVKATQNMKELLENTANVE